MGRLASGSAVLGQLASGRESVNVPVPVAMASGSAVLGQLASGGESVPVPRAMASVPVQRASDLATSSAGVHGRQADSALPVPGESGMVNVHSLGEAEFPEVEVKPSKLVSFEIAEKMTKVWRFADQTNEDRSDTPTPSVDFFGEGE